MSPAVPVAWFSPSIHEWQGWRSVQIEVQDFQPGNQARLLTYNVTRDK